MRRRHNIKGPVFPSFLHARSGPQMVRTWKPGTQSLRQRIKYLTAACREILDSRDADTMRAGSLIFKACEQEAVPKLASLILINAAREAASDTGLPWPACANVVMNSFLEARVARLKALAEQPIATASTPIDSQSTS